MCVTLTAGMDGLGSAPLLSMLRCAGCRAAGLCDDGAVLACRACGRRFPVQADIPVMVTDAVAHRGPLLEPAAARTLMQRLGIPSDPVTILRVRRASGARVRLHAGSGRHLPHDGRVLAGLPAVPQAATPTAREDVRCEWLREYLPRSMRPDEEILANVQFRNAGAVTMASAGDGRVTLACRWASVDGHDVAVEDVRTPLPADLLPGQVLTLPVRLRTPPLAGRYTLALTMVQEGVRWLEPAFGPFGIGVDPQAGFVPPAHWVMDGPGPHDRVGDRARATALMRDWVSRHAPPAPRVLELGGGASPASAAAGWEATVVDGDLLALQLGRLVPGASPRALCADLADLPLAEADFDVVVCFGALHYLPDPATALRNLRAHLRPGGFIGVFCEPVGQMWPGAPTPSVLAELRRGLNPQGFSAAEYHQIFQAARLRAVELVVDGASLKARLEPEGRDA